MERKPNYSKVYAKELATLIKAGKVDSRILDSLITKLCNGQTLEPKYKDHALVKSSPKQYQGCRDFHYKGNICVVYRLTPTTVDLLRIGSHSALNLTEVLSGDLSF